MRLSSLFIISSLLFVVLLHSAFALSSIEVSSPKNASVYNTGASVAITGQITTDKNVAGAEVSFSAASIRLNKTIPIAAKFFNFNANTPVTFTQINKGTLSWNIPANGVQSNDWTIYVKVYKEPKLIVDYYSANFTVSKALTLLVSSNTKLLNLGETIEASGTALGANGEPITGTALVLMDHGVLGNVTSETAIIEDGYLSFSYKLKRSDPAGNYTLSFRATDPNGNVAVRVLSGITVTDKLAVQCTIPKEKYEPGDEFDLIGNVKDAHSKPMGSANISAYLNFPSKPVSISSNSKSDGNGNFAVHVDIPKLAEPGLYGLDAIAEDTEGNSGSCYKTFLIPGEENVFVGLNLNSSWYYYGTEGGFDLNVKNNGNTDLAGTVSVIIDNKETDGFNFAVRKGAEIKIPYKWGVSSAAGLHTISALLLSNEGKVLTQTIPQSFTVYAHPGPSAKPDMTKWAFALIGVAFIASFLYIKRKEIRDYLWHWELQSEYGIGRKRILPKEKKKEEHE